MKLFKTILIACCMLGIAAGSTVEGQPAKPSTKAPTDSFTRLTAQELTLLLEDVVENNPKLLERLQEDAELRKGQLESLRQLLAFASEARKTLLPSNPQFEAELENIRVEVVATNYDKYLNKGKAANGSFGYIPAAAVAAYWGDGPGSPLSASVKAGRKANFEKFLTIKLHLLEKANPDMKNREL